MRLLLSIFLFGACCGLAGAQPAVALNQLVEEAGAWRLAGATSDFTGVAVAYHANGQKRVQINFREGLKHGREEAWYEDGRLQYSVRYVQGKPQSYGSSWYGQEAETVAAAPVLNCADLPRLQQECAAEKTNEAGVMQACALSNQMAAICAPMLAQQKPSSSIAFCDGRTTIPGLCEVRADEARKTPSKLTFCQRSQTMTDCLR